MAAEAAAAAAAFSGEQESRADEEQGQAPILPIGYRFAPREHELILEYLLRKIMGVQLPSNAVRDIDLYEHDPLDLPTSDFKHGKNRNEAYYFTQTRQRDSKTEPTRSSKGGYWKDCGEEEIYHDEVIGFKKTLVFYRGDATGKMEKKSSWVMNEYRVNPSISNFPTEVALDDSIKFKAKMQRCVICKIENKDDSAAEEDVTKQSCWEIKAEEGQVDDPEKDNLNY